MIPAAAAFGLDAAQLRPLAGNSGSAWDAGVLPAGQQKIHCDQMTSLPTIFAFLKPPD